MNNDVKRLVLIVEKELNNASLNLPYKDFVSEIINLLKIKVMDEKIKYDVLVELFKYVKFGDTVTSIDMRGDKSIKFSALNNIKDAIDKNTLSQNNINDLNKINKLCLSYILDPLKLTKSFDKFYRENPNARI